MMANILLYMLTLLYRKKNSAVYSSMEQSAPVGFLLLFFLHVVGDLATCLGSGQQFVAGLLGEGGKVLDRTRVGRQDFQHLSAGDFGQGFLGTQDGQGTVQTTCIEFFIEIHVVLLTLNPLNRHVLKNAAVP